MATSAAPPSSSAPANPLATTSAAAAPPPPASASSSGGAGDSPAPKPKKKKKASGESSSAAAPGAAAAAAPAVARSSAIPNQDPAPFGLAKVRFVAQNGTPLPEGLWIYAREMNGPDQREFRIAAEGKQQFTAMHHGTYKNFAEHSGALSATKPSESHPLACREAGKPVKWEFLPSWTRLTEAQFREIPQRALSIPNWGTKRFLDFANPQERSASGAVTFKVLIPPKPGVPLAFVQRNGNPLPAGTWVYVGADKEKKPSKMLPYREFLICDGGEVREVDLEVEKGRNSRTTLATVGTVEFPSEVEGFKVGYAFLSSSVQFTWNEFKDAVDDDVLTDCVHRDLEKSASLEKANGVGQVKLSTPNFTVKLHIRNVGRAAMADGRRLYIGRKDGADWKCIAEYGLVGDPAAAAATDLQLKKVDLAAQAGDRRTPDAAEVTEIELPRAVEGFLANYSFMIDDERPRAKLDELVGGRDAKRVTDLLDDQQVPLATGFRTVVAPTKAPASPKRLTVIAIDDARQKLDRGADHADEEAVLQAVAISPRLPVQALAVMVSPTDVSGFKFDNVLGNAKDALTDPGAFYSDHAGKSWTNATAEEKAEDEAKELGVNFSVEASFAAGRAASTDKVKLKITQEFDGTPTTVKPPRLLSPGGAAPAEISDGSLAKGWTVEVTAPQTFPTWVPSFGAHPFDPPFTDKDWVRAQLATQPIHKVKIHKVQFVDPTDPNRALTTEVHSLPCWGAVRAVKSKPLFNAKLLTVPIGPCELKVKLGVGGLAYESFVGWKIDDGVGRISREHAIKVNFAELTVTLEFSILSAVTGIPKLLLDYIADITLSAALTLGVEGSVTSVEERKYIVARKQGERTGLSDNLEKYVKGGLKPSATFEVALEARIGKRILEFSVKGSIKVPITGTWEYSTEGLTVAGTIKHKRSIDREAVKLKVSFRVKIGWIYEKEKAKEWVLMKRSNQYFYEETVPLSDLGVGLGAIVARGLLATQDPLPAAPAP